MAVNLDINRKGYNPHVLYDPNIYTKRAWNHKNRVKGRANRRKAYGKSSVKNKFTVPKRGGHVPACDRESLSDRRPVREEAVSYGKVTDREGEYALMENVPMDCLAPLDEMFWYWEHFDEISEEELGYIVRQVLAYSRKRRYLPLYYITRSTYDTETRGRFEEMLLAKRNPQYNDYYESSKGDYDVGQEEGKRGVKYYGIDLSKPQLGKKTIQMIDDGSSPLVQHPYSKWWKT